VSGPRRSAGLLLYRRTAAGDVEVLLAHPGGPLWAKRDAGVWTVPKGEFRDGEAAWAVARREFEEETGHPAPDGDPTELG
jgi:predicted NUDIX family NTP pyrophosphohydrolase